MTTGTESGSPQPLHQANSKSALDVATIFGISMAVILIGLAIFLGGSATAFIDGPAILIVVGGTFGVTTACFSLRDMKESLSVIGDAFIRTKTRPSDAAIQLLQLAQIARFKGILAIQQYIESVDEQPMLAQGLSMIIDGTAAEEAEDIMRQEVQAITQRQYRSISVLKKAAELAPAMGLIGTLVGLVQMLGNLEDPNSIGPAMAVALLTTFYGACLANVVFTPLAAKMERNAMEQALLNNLFVMATASMARQENPRRLEMLLNTILPPSERVDYFG